MPAAYFNASNPNRVCKSPSAWDQTSAYWFSRPLSQCQRPITQESTIVTDPRRFPWLGGLIAAITIAVWLVYEVIGDAIAVIGSSIDTTAV